MAPWCATAASAVGILRHGRRHRSSRARAPRSATPPPAWPTITHPIARSAKCISITCSTDVSLNTDPRRRSSPSKTRRSPKRKSATRVGQLADMVEHLEGRLDKIARKSGDDEFRFQQSLKEANESLGRASLTAGPPVPRRRGGASAARASTLCQSLAPPRARCAHDSAASDCRWWRGRRARGAPRGEARGLLVRGSAGRADRCRCSERRRVARCSAEPKPGCAAAPAR